MAIPTALPAQHPCRGAWLDHFHTYFHRSQASAARRQQHPQVPAPYRGLGINSVAEDAATSSLLEH